MSLPESEYRCKRCGHFFANYASSYKSIPPVKCKNCGKENPLNLDADVIKKRLEKLKLEKLKKKSEKREKLKFKLE